MSLDLSAAVEAAARAWRDESARMWPAFAADWADLPAATRRNDCAVMTAALEAAAPLIESAVRAQVAAEIRAGIGAEPLLMYVTDWRDGMETAADIARGVS